MQKYHRTVEIKLGAVPTILNAYRLYLVHLIHRAPHNTLGHQAAVLHVLAAHDQGPTGEVIALNLKDGRSVVHISSVRLGPSRGVILGHAHRSAIDGNGEATGKRHIERYFCCQTDTIMR